MDPTAVLFQALTATIVREPVQTDGQVRDRVRFIVREQTIPVSPEAADLLAGYLRVIHAYFAASGDYRWIIVDFYDQIADRLGRITDVTHQPVSRQDVSRLIRQLGCVSDWLLRPDTLDHGWMPGSTA